MSRIDSSESPAASETLSLSESGQVLGRSVWRRSGVGSIWARFPARRYVDGQWRPPANRVYALRAASERAAAMNANGKITQEIYKGEDLWSDIGL